MLYIDDLLPNIQQAWATHVKVLTCYVNRKVFGNIAAARCTDRSCAICKSQMRPVKMSDNLFNALCALDLEKLISATPHQLADIQQEFEYYYGSPALTDADKEDLKKIINYEWFKDNDKYTAYDLCKSLQIESCIYCNRMYTSTVVKGSKERVIRPTLDHWFAESDFPLLGLSFYNLIPSCSPCNSSVKLTKKFTLNDNMHPYVDQDITQKYQLRALYDKSLHTYRVDINAREQKVEDTLAAMDIARIYEHHQSELADLNTIKTKYNKTYLESLGALLGGGMDEKDVYRIMFGVEFEDENFHKRPLSKLKKDILTG